MKLYLREQPLNYLRTGGIRTLGLGAKATGQRRALPYEIKGVTYSPPTASAYMGGTTPPSTPTKTTLKLRA